MRVIILAGGYGTRISEETEDKPKPMVLLDDKPIIWHLMNIFAAQGFREFVLATGYKGHVIHEWVENLRSPWSITPIDTGNETLTGGRVRQCLEYIGRERVFATYGDGLGNVNLHKLLDFHIHQGRSATVTAVRPPARFGLLESSNGLVTNFSEKNQTHAGWINGGFFVFNKGIFDYLIGDHVMLEREPMEKLVSDGELMAYSHSDFWQCMDTIRDKEYLETLLKENKAPWLKK